MDVNMHLVMADYEKRTTEVLHFNDVDLALDADEEHEHATADQPRVEVVPISMDNEDDLRRGYWHMFMPPGLPRTSEGWADSKKRRGRRASTCGQADRLRPTTCHHGLRIRTSRLADSAVRSADRRAEVESFRGNSCHCGPLLTLADTIGTRYD
jgi:hypothetical protein